MKKPYPHTEKSFIRCQRCGKGIKQNLVARKLNTPRFCYKCHCIVEAITRNHTINTKARRKRIDFGLPVKRFA